MKKHKSEHIYSLNLFTLNKSHSYRIPYFQDNTVRVMCDFTSCTPKVCAE